LKIKDTLAGPQDGYARRRTWEATEAARLLSRHADKTVPPIVAQLPEADRADVKWHYYALGLCGTDEAITALKTHALTETNGNWTDAVVYAISITGDKAAAALEELDTKARGQLKGSIARYRQGRLGDQEKDIDFPELSNVPVLPKSVDDLKAAEQPDEQDE